MGALGGWLYRKKQKKLTWARPQSLLLPPAGAFANVDEFLSSAFETSNAAFTSALSFLASSCRGSEDRLELDKSFLGTWASTLPFGVDSELVISVICNKNKI